MLRRGDTKATGFSLVELIVVMTIFAILAAVAIPGLARLGIFSRNELPGTAQELHSLLVSANVYASTNHVSTAVTYNMDNWVDPLINTDNTAGLSAPIIDSVTTEHLRVIQAAAMMYSFKYTAAATSTVVFQPTTDISYGDEVYVPVGNSDGTFKTFPGRMTMLLQDPASTVLQPVYVNDNPRFLQSGSSGVAALGMRAIRAEWYRKFDPNLQKDVIYWAWFPAHVFTSANRLDTAGTKEHFQVLIAPSPDTPPDSRLSVLENGRVQGNLLSIAIDLYKSTGRVKVAS